MLAQIPSFHIHTVEWQRKLNHMLKHHYHPWVEGFWCGQQSLLTFLSLSEYHFWFRFPISIGRCSGIRLLGAVLAGVALGSYGGNALWHGCVSWLARSSWKVLGTFCLNSQLGFPSMPWCVLWWHNYIHCQLRGASAVLFRDVDKKFHRPSHVERFWGLFTCLCLWVFFFLSWRSKDSGASLTFEFIH